MREITSPRPKQLGLLINAMRLCLSIFILSFLCWSFDAGAQDQVPGQQFSSSVPSQWQMTLDEIKSKAQNLVIQNNGLQDEYQELMELAQKLQQAIADQQSKNEQMARFIQERHGQTDQQLRIGELTKNIRTKSQRVSVYVQQLENLNRKQAGLEHNIQMMKDTISNIEFHQQAEKHEVQPSQNTAQPRVDDQLVPLRKQLEDNIKQEVLLGNELGALKAGDKTKNLNAGTVDSENKQLQARLDVLQSQMVQHEKESSDAQIAQATARMYDHLKKRKDELEADIYSYELRMDQLRQSSLLAISWQFKKKKIVHEMVQADARNNQLRYKIKVLREDIGVLKDQVAQLERQVNAAGQSKDNFVTFKTSE